MSVTITPFWVSDVEDLRYGQRLELPVSNGLTLAEAGLVDLGNTTDTQIFASLFAESSNRPFTRAGEATDEFNFSMFHIDRLLRRDQANAIMHIAATALHEVVHCVRFAYIPFDSTAEEAVATEVLAYGAESAFLETYFGVRMVNRLKSSPDQDRSKLIADDLKDGASLDKLVRLPTEEIMGVS